MAINTARDMLHDIRLALRDSYEDIVVDSETWDGTETGAKVTEVTADGKTFRIEVSEVK